MPAKKARVPKYCLHKPSGQAYVRIRGRVVYLGVYDSPESKQEYGRLIAELAAQPDGTADSGRPSRGITIVEVIAAYVDYAEQYYRKDGKSTGHMPGLLAAMRILRELYGGTEAAKFGPLSLRAIQNTLIERGASRRYINQHCGHIKRMFKWAVSMEILSSAVHQSLATVPGLKRGRTTARESKPILPVEDDLVNATLPYMPEIVADMVRVHRLIGCRPSEVCQLRPCDVDTTGDVWLYRPESHKTQHHGRERIVFIGPKAQDVLLPYLERDSKAHCFSPAESVARRHEKQRAKRKTKVQPSQRNRRKAKPKRQAKTSYNKDSYNRAIRRAIEKANRARILEASDMGIKPIVLPHWHANQLRHSAATRIRKEYGLEAAQVILGHSQADVTQIYAERDSALAVEVARKIG